MIDLISVTKEYIEQQSRQIRIQDPAVLERTIHAFILLERLALSRMDFLFKGGTSLLLLLDRPQRVSVDIDIVCQVSREDFEGNLQKWIKNPPFTGWKRDERESDREPPTRRHYKVFYNAIFGGLLSPSCVLLDVVEEKSGIDPQYTAKKEVDCAFLALKGTPSQVRVPFIDAILADKLTAFAPNTTGVHFNNPRLQEDSSHQVFKQLFDVAQLFDAMSDFTVVRDTYFSVVKKEAEYKGISNVPQSVLCDTLQTAFDICTFDKRIKKLPPDYEKYISGGISKMASDLISGGRFSIPEAKIAASKAGYLAASLLTNQNRCLRFRDTEEVRTELKAHRFQNQFGILDRIKANIESYWYWCEIMKLSEYTNLILQLK